MINLNLRLVTFVAVVANAGAPVQAQTSSTGSGQSYPTRPIRLLSGFAPGGATDIAARAVAQKLNEFMGQPVVVENRPGAAGNVAAEMIVRSAPDGYLIYLANATIATPSLFTKVPFDVTKDFAFVSMIGLGPSGLVVHPSVPVRSMKALIALARQQPGKLNFASGGTGNISHLAMELFASMAKIDMVHVPCKGGAPSTIATVSGEAHLMFSSIASMLGQIQQGRLRVLAVSSAKRSLVLPNVPTVSEEGLAGYEASSWYGLIVAAATPPAVVSRLSNETVKALALAEVKERLSSQGIEPVAGGADDFRKYVMAEIPKWAKVIRDAKIPPQ